MNDIDLVVLWVDGNDPKWQQERDKYLKNKITNSGYYQDWNWMRYWFRAVEENMPWIRNVFFITYGHTPSWLNLNHPKLRIVKHEDFMPKEFLPTFSPIPININLHRIKELSETFIYSEDDIFFIGKQEPEDFFSKEGLPKDFLWLRPITEQFDLSDYSHIILNNVLTIKKHIGMESINKGKGKYLFSEKYPKEVIDANKQLHELKLIPGFKETHMAYSLLKSSFDDLWKKEELQLFTCSMHRFRLISDITVSLFRDYQLASLNFEPYYPKYRYSTNVYNPNLEKLILDKDTNMICINESNDKAYTKERAEEICSYLEKRFPNKSSYEMD